MKYTTTLSNFLIYSLVLLSTACQDKAQTGTLTVVNKDSKVETSDNKTPRTTEGLREDYIKENRLIWQKPALVINLMGELENKTIADIGAGSGGFFSTRLARNAKKVIAIDIDPKTIADLDSVRQTELPFSLQDRLEPRLSKPDEANLEPGEVDVVLIVNTFMYIPNRIGYLRKLMESIASGGQVIIIDFKKKRTPVGPDNQFRIPAFQIEEELYKAGYTNIVVNDTALDYQYMVIGHKRPEQ